MTNWIVVKICKHEIISWQEKAESQIILLLTVWFSDDKLKNHERYSVAFISLCRLLPSWSKEFCPDSWFQFQVYDLLA